MKFRFAVVELLAENAAIEDSIANQIASLKAAHSAAQRSTTKTNAASAAISAASETQSSAASQCFQLKHSQPLPPEIADCQFAFVCGLCDTNELLERCRQLADIGIAALVVVDAFEKPEQLAAAFSELETKNVQLVKAAAVHSMLKSKHEFIYPYAKPDCTATVCLFFDEGKNTLVIERKHDPFKGKHAFPGGFLRVMLETIEESAVRELEEECSLKLASGELIQVDVRSAPDRDPRAHVVDVGFAALIDNKRKNELLAQLKAADDAAKAQLIPVADLLANGMAFDHLNLLTSALTRLSIQQP